MRIASRLYSDEEQLAEIDRRLARLPDALDLRFERACCLEDLGWNEAASQAYFAVLQRDPAHLGSLTNLGLMARQDGDLTTAHTFFTRALVHHPLATIALVNLGRVFLDQGEVASAVKQYMTALDLDPEFFAAHHGLAMLYENSGDPDRAQYHMKRAFEKRASWTRPYAGTAAPLRVLLLVSARGGDIVSHPFLDDRIMETTIFVVEGFRDGMVLPAHDVVFNSIGDADRCREPLEGARALRIASTAAVINNPDSVLATGRAANAERLGRITGVVVPRTERVVRSAVTAAELAADGWTFPLLVRTPGHHAGRYFEHVAEPAAIPEMLARVPGDALFVIEFVDLRDADGFLRKYRVLFVDGRIYPAHLAISRDWKVHYFSADMADRPDHRVEEQRFLNDMAATLGAAVLETLEQIGRVLGLDYGGVDFGIDLARNVVIFEANATMAVYAPAAEERWAYRKPTYEAIVAAVRALIASRSAAAPQDVPQSRENTNNG